MDDFKLHLSTPTEEFYTPLGDLLFIQSNGNNVDIYTRTGKKTFRDTLTNIQELIDKEGLFKFHGCARVGRGYIVNFNNVLSIDLNKFYEMENGKKRTYYGKILFKKHNDKHVVIPLNKTEIEKVKAFMEQLGRNPFLKYSKNSYELTAPVSEMNKEAKRDFFIDLGLPSGTKWGMSNLDASECVEKSWDNEDEIDIEDDMEDEDVVDGVYNAIMPDNENESYHGHVSWGEIVSKDIYVAETYTFNWGVGLSEYEEDDEELYGFPEKYDYKFFLWDKCNNQLPSHFDIAAKEYKTNSIHIPTADDWKELIDNCTFVWCKSHINTYGLLATSKTNGHCIFLPASGYRNKKNIIKEGQMLAYWTSTFASSSRGKAFVFDKSKTGGNLKIVSLEGYFGLSIRPVQGGHLAPNPNLRREFKIKGTTYRIEDPKNKNCSLFSYWGKPSMLVIPKAIKIKDEIYTVTTINEKAFHEAPKSIFIPATIKKLPKVRPLTVVQSIEVAENHPSFSSENGVLFDKDKKTLLIKPDAGDKVYKVPDGVERIAENAFLYSEISIVDTNQVTQIDAHAFYMSNVKRIQGYCVKVLETECFNGCNSLETIDFPNVLEVKQCAFSGCDKLKHIIFPKLEKCEYGAFNNCDAVSMTFHSQIEKLYSNLFRDCNYLEKIEFKIIPKKVCPDPFCNCEKLKTIIVAGKSYTREEFNQTFCP